MDNPNFVSAIQAGNARALERWFSQHRDGVYAHAFYRLGGNRELAADATQATFLVALERLHEFDPERGSMRSWLKVLSQNILRDLRNREAQTFSLEGLWELACGELQQSLLQLDRSNVPDQLVVRDETRELVAATLCSLPDVSRMLLESKYIHRQSLNEIAQAMDLSIDAVKSRLKRARTAFRDCFLRLSKLEVTDV